MAGNLFDVKLNGVKGSFFDAQKVLDATDNAERKVLSKFGAFVRRTARTSIRKHAKPSQASIEKAIRKGKRPKRTTSRPGKPPYDHTGLLKRNIFFAYERSRHSVVIGPVALNQRSGVPELLEYGGRAMRKIKGKMKRVTYKPRPFMGPAMARNLPALPAMWADSIKG